MKPGVFVIEFFLIPLDGPANFDLSMIENIFERLSISFELLDLIFQSLNGFQVGAPSDLLASVLPLGLRLALLGAATAAVLLSDLLINLRPPPQPHIHLLQLLV